MDELTEEQIHNLKILREFLWNNVPDNRFKYTSFVGYDWKGLQDLSCGTTACALGWATQVPEFKKYNLIIYSHDGFSNPGIAFADDLGIYKNDDVIDFIFGRASREIFYPKSSDDCDCYSSHHCGWVYEDDFTAKDVAMKIDRFLENLR